MWSIKSLWRSITRKRGEGGKDEAARTDDDLESEASALCLGVEECTLKVIDAGEDESPLGDECDAKPVERIPCNTEVTAEQWRERFVHVANKLAMVLGVNNEERQWIRDAGYNVPDER